MNRRVVPLLAASCTAVVFGAIGFGSLMISLVFVGPAVALLVYVAVTRRRPAPAEARWTSPALAQPVLAAPGRPRQVAAALGRVESHELAVSAWFGIGLGFLAVIFTLLAVVYVDDNGDTWLQAAGMSPWFAHPLAGMTVVATHRAATRPARDGTDELYESCPTEPAVRAVALLRTAAVPAAVFAGFLVVYGVAIYVGSESLHGPVSLDALPVVLAGPVLAAGSVFLGVALGSWVRFGLAPVIAVVGVGLLALQLATAGDPGWNSSSALSTFGPQADSPLLLPLLPRWSYLLWMVALAVLVAVVALLRFRRDRPVWLAGAAAIALAMVAASFATRPVADESRLVADLIARPAAHQTCSEPTGVRVEICTYDGYGELRERVAAAVVPIGRALPATAPLISVQQRFDGTEADLPPAVVAALPVGLPSPAEDEVWIGFGAADDALLGYRLRVAFTALGLALPSGAEDGEGPLPIDGQARGVVALWLAARGLDLDDALHLATVEEPGDSDENLIRGETTDPFEHGLAWPTMCGPVVWSPEDLEAARAVLRLPEAEVAAVVSRGFHRWSDAGTGTDELLVELGLPRAGPYTDIVSRTESFC